MPAFAPGTYNTATGNLYAQADEPELRGPSEPVRTGGSAPPATVDTALNLQFSHLADVDPDQLN
ncbi:hypothetical protein QN355_09115 [Cryobacterium sp. 10S3]|uniref:hypothetical protein n=1 Tax=Cryobacterium sp. 10S3 TaxID=3048582 RepID=UPI002AC92B99|nr:hypothetical protein [Cryobacterium sp. 10S3]MEB0286709.1 hypothetical protein [Cryobacterium sp. 10S3]WPX13170.1 hypothetical protein RHM57_16095 [Cryobacterium sp. 10S3]